MIYKLEIFEDNSRNFKKNGGLTKKATTAAGSMTVSQPDEQERKKISLIDHLMSHGYTNIYTGYIDNVLFLEKNGIEYKAFQSIQMSHWINPLTIGFSSDLKNLKTIKN